MSRRQKRPRFLRLLPSVMVVGAGLLVLKASGLVHDAYAAGQSSRRRRRHRAGAQAGQQGLRRRRQAPGRQRRRSGRADQPVQAPRANWTRARPRSRPRPISWPPPKRAWTPRSPSSRQLQGPDHRPAGPARRRPAKADRRPGEDLFGDEAQGCRPHLRRLHDDVLLPVAPGDEIRRAGADPGGDERPSGPEADGQAGQQADPARHHAAPAPVAASAVTTAPAAAGLPARTAPISQATATGQSGARRQGRRLRRAVDLAHNRVHVKVYRRG